MVDSEAHDVNVPSTSGVRLVKSIKKVRECRTVCVKCTQQFKNDAAKGVDLVLGIGVVLDSETG